MMLTWVFILHTLIPNLATVPMSTLIARGTLLPAMMLVTAMGEFGTSIQKCMFF